MPELALEKMVLPNGLPISVSAEGKGEAKRIYNEIFSERAYLKNRISIKDGDCIFDVGANIGLFTMWLTQQWKDLDVWSFEPVPVLYNALEKNVSPMQNGNRVHLHNIGISNESGKRSISFMVEMPGNSTVYYDKKQDEMDLVLNGLGIRDLWRINKLMFPLLLILYPFRHKLLSHRWRESCLNTVNYSCHFDPLSKIIRESNVKKINLLKIDVEGSELDVIRGIEEKDWSIVDQVVMECAPHNSSALPGLKELLTKYGFKKIIIERLGHRVELKDKEKPLNHISMIYARKNPN